MGGGWYSGFQVKEVIKGFFFAFEIFDSGIFLDRKIRQVFFGVDIETYTEILALTHVISFN